MAYIGYNPSQLAIAPFATKYFTGDGTTTTFTLDQSVPGANEANVEVFVENVQQNPVDAYTIGGALNNQLIFSEAPVTGGAIYVIHKGEATYNLQPATGSVTAATLDPVLRNFTVDNFTGDGSATTFTLTDTPYSPNSILVTVDGIVQTASTNYTVSGTTLSFGTSAPDSGAIITVVHLGFSSGNKAVMDASITPVKLSVGGPYWSTAGNFRLGEAPSVFESARKVIQVGSGSFNYHSAGTIQIANNWYNSSGTNLYLANGYATRYQQTVAGQHSFQIAPSGSANGAISFTEALTIDYRGKVSIGGVAPSNWKSTWPSLDIGQAASFYSQDNNTTGIGSNLYFTGSTWGRKNSGAAALYQLSEGGHYWYSNPTGAADSTFSPTTIMQIENSGILTLPYGQIKFPAAVNASSDPNTLDDYEEGTWTPTLYSQNSAAYSFTTLTSYGTYTKVGNLVTLNFWVTFNGTRGGAGGDNVGINNLPFPARSGSIQQYPAGLMTMDPAALADNASARAGSRLTLFNASNMMLFATTGVPTASNAYYNGNFCQFMLTVNNGWVSGSVTYNTTT